MKLTFGPEGKVGAEVGRSNAVTASECPAGRAELAREWIAMEQMLEVRREGRRILEQAAEQIGPMLLAATCEEARDEFWRLMLEAAKKRWKPRADPVDPARPRQSLLPPGYVATEPVPDTTRPAPPAPPVRTKTPSPSYMEATNLVEEICELAESPDLPSPAVDYAESVREKAVSIGETVEDMGRATPNQLGALRNMLSGLERWTRD